MALLWRCSLSLSFLNFTTCVCLVIKFKKKKKKRLEKKQTYKWLEPQRPGGPNAELAVELQCTWSLKVNVAFALAWTMLFAACVEQWNIDRTSFNCPVCKSKGFKVRIIEKQHVFTSRGLNSETVRTTPHWMNTPDILVGVHHSSHIAHKDVFGFTNKHWQREDSGRCLIFKYAPTICQTSADVNYEEANIGALKSPSGLQITPAERVFLPDLRGAILRRGRNWKNWSHYSSKHKALIRHQLHHSSLNEHQSGRLWSEWLFCKAGVLFLLCFFL